MIIVGAVHLGQGHASAHHRQTPYLKKEALAAMDAADVDRAVIHPVMWDPDWNELAVERPGPSRSLPHHRSGYLDQPEQRVLEQWKGRPRMKGLRFYFTDPRRGPADDDTLDGLFHWPSG